MTVSASPFARRDGTLNPYRNAAPAISLAALETDPELALDVVADHVDATGDDEDFDWNGGHGSEVLRGSYLDRHLPFDGFLEPEDEARLIAAVKNAGDERSRTDIFASFRPLVQRMAATHKKRLVPSMTMDDYVSQGMVGLATALDRFAAEHETRLGTYAGWWIRSEINGMVLENMSPVRAGAVRMRKKLYQQMPRARKAVEAEHPNATADEVEALIAERLGVKVEDVREAVALARPAKSLSAAFMADAEDVTPEVLELLALSSPDALPEDAVYDAECRERMREAVVAGMAALNERERFIVTNRHLVVGDDEVMTLRQVAAHFGVSLQRIAEVEKGAIRKLKAAILAHLDGGEVRDLLPC